MITFHTYDLGYGLAMLWGRKLVFKVRLPIPLSVASIKYLLKHRGKV